MGREGIRTTTLPTGEAVPVLGQGTWHMAENRKRRKDEIAALRTGIELGLTLIDTAEMYADGEAEELVSDAIDGVRDQVFLVSKVLPSSATSRRRAVAACERSLRRLGTDRIDLFLLHWREHDTPLDDVVEAFAELREDGKILHWGVSNFDVDDMEDLVAAQDGADVATNQILYNVQERGAEFALMPWCRERGIPIMAYSPLEQGELHDDDALVRIARRHDATAAQVALAWVLRRPDVIAIPKSGRAEHVRANARALDLRLSDDDLSELDRAYPPPARKQPLASH